MCSAADVMPKNGGLARRQPLQLESLLLAAKGPSACAHLSATALTTTLRTVIHRNEAGNDQEEKVEKTFKETNETHTKINQPLHHQQNTHSLHVSGPYHHRSCPTPTDVSDLRLSVEADTNDHLTDQPQQQPPPTHTLCVEVSASSSSAPSPAGSPRPSPGPPLRSPKRPRSRSTPKSPRSPKFVLAKSSPLTEVDPGRTPHNTPSAGPQPAPQDDSECEHLGLGPAQHALPPPNIYRIQSQPHPQPPHSHQSGKHHQQPPRGNHQQQPALLSSQQFGGARSAGNESVANPVAQLQPQPGVVSDSSAAAQLQSKPAFIIVHRKSLPVFQSAHSASPRLPRTLSAPPTFPRDLLNGGHPDAHSASGPAPAASAAALGLCVDAESADSASAPDLSAAAASAAHDRDGDEQPQREDADGDEAVVAEQSAAANHHHSQEEQEAAEPVAKVSESQPEPQQEPQSQPKRVGQRPGAEAADRKAADCGKGHGGHGAVDGDDAQ